MLTKKKAGTTLSVIDKAFSVSFFKCLKNVRHFIMRKGTSDSENITVINLYAPNSIALRRVINKSQGIQGEIDRNTSNTRLYFISVIACRSLSS